MADYKRPLPVPDVDSKEFWDSCKRHELQLQKCQECHEFHFPPGPICPNCFSTNLKWEKISGKGEVHSYTTVHRPSNPDWDDAVPYNISAIALDEGPHMLSNVVGCRPQEVKIGMKVEVTFDDVTGDITLPKFKPAT
jgi:uncharacterized OB-fold protein